MNMLDIFAIPAFDDNYIWTIVNGKEAIVVDPGDPKPVIKTFEEKGLNLTKILITHHHFDHSGGILDLVKKYKPSVYGPAGGHIQGISNPMSDQYEVEVFGKKFIAIATPGHTDDQLGYYCEENSPPILFSGDTLFASGCGRIFEGTPAEMYKSIGIYYRLPKNTQVYCGHEYTESNLKFAIKVEPNNQSVKDRLNEVKEKRSRKEITLPSTIELEQKTNPFMRCSEDAVVKAVKNFSGKDIEDPVDVFAAVRGWKDNS